MRLAFGAPHCGRAELVSGTIKERYRLVTDSIGGALGERRVRISLIGGWPKRRLYSRGTFVSDLKGRTCGVQTIDKHASSRCLQPQLLLILKRTHGGQRPEMVVQRGQPHSRDLCEIFHP